MSTPIDAKPTITDLLARDLLAPQSLQQARALPAQFYTDPRMVALERRAVFARSWQLAGHLTRIPEPGDHLVTESPGLPVIVLRDEHGQVRAFHNVCRHRGGPLATQDGCGARRLRCRYHGWTYGLDGVLRSAPEMREALDFDPAQVRLPALQVRTWQGLIFVAEGDAPDFDAFLAGIAERLGNRRFDDYRFHRRVSYEIACNWKVYADNYLEGYHVPHIHPGLNRVLDYRSYVTQVHDWYSFQYSPLESAEGLYGSGEALYWFLYPNTMLNSLPGRLQTNRIVPLGVDRCRVDFDYYYPHEEGAQGQARRASDEAFSDEVQDEDRLICEQVQAGLASGSYEPGRLNPLRENAVHHFQELLRAAWRRDSAA
ncbi:MAG TPA: aromatic ring-hydroxylating dioxygenase subunit alpha [Xanthomonadaceae bacterium]|nr:aromatic ring-hydroxylating dioxygenase subunit alpha [Xanthomonadaceae bacterium]